MFPDDLIERALGWFAVVFFAALGRLIWHAEEVKRGNRQFWSRALALDMIIACGMGVIAHGICVWAGITSHVAGAFIAAAGYLGPHAIDVIFNKKYGGESAAQKGSNDEKS